MHHQTLPLALLAAGTAVHAVSLADVCTPSYAQGVLPSDTFYPGITIDPSSVSAQLYTNYSATGSEMYPDAVFDYCNVTFAYTHTGRDDIVHVAYWLPSPDKFQDRFLATGGGGLAINSGDGSLPGGVSYGASAGLTDGGFGTFDTNVDAVFLLANGTINWEALFMFGYQGIHEMTVLGKEFTKNFFNMSDTKLYSYYQACSEGGREGFSQVQRYGSQYDGVIMGAPAFRYGQQQVNHLVDNVVEQTLNYYPSTCEFAKIVNLTITACDPLDGKTDGVISRTDLCKLRFNLNSTIGEPYYCDAVAAVPSLFTGMPSTPATPAVNGTVSAQGVLVAQTIMDGLKDSKGRQVYFSYQPGNSFDDAQTTYDSTTGKWGLDISGLGGEWVTRFLELRNTSDIETLQNVTYDTLKDWMAYGMQTYYDTLQTTWPDLTPFHKAGAKVLTFHGESDNSVPTASSVRYWNSVREVMYPDLSFNESSAKLSEWYKLFLVPGAAHCAPNTLQPNGPFPQTNFAVLIDWVENGVVPVTLNATVLQGENEGQNQQICEWPLRPFWVGDDMECRFDWESIQSWFYDLNAWKFPVF